MFEFDMLQCGLLILILIVIGEAISRYMKAAVPSILIAGIIFLACLWGGLLPADMVAKSGLLTLTPVGIMLVIVNMGASTNVKELLANWRVVTLSAVSFCCQLVLLFLVIGGVFGINTAVGALPGGSTTALIVQEKARYFGYENIVVLSVLILSVKGLISCPLVSWCLKREVKRVQKVGITSEAVKSTEASQKEAAPAKKKWFGGKGGEQREHTQYEAFLRLYAVAWLASRVEIMTGVSRYVLCLVFGVLFVELGFLRKNELNQTQSQGLIFFMMMAMILSGFASATPQMFLQMLVPLVCVLACEVMSIFLVSTVLGPRLGFSRAMSQALCLNIMVGFPLNMMISEDVIRYLVKDKAEQERLIPQIATKMVLAGFTSTTVLATVSAGFLVNLMH